MFKKVIQRSKTIWDGRRRPAASSTIKWGEYEKTHGIGGGVIFGKVIEARGYKQGQRFKIGFDEKRIVLNVI